MITVDSELVRLLMRTGYLAAWNGFFKEAVRIFDGVASVRPESEQPLIGGATVAMISGDFALSASILEKALSDHPNNSMVLAHKACILRLQNEEEEGLRLLQEVIDKGDDENAVSLAKNIQALSIEALKLNSSVS